MLTTITSGGILNGTQEPVNATLVPTLDEESCLTMWDTVIAVLLFAVFAIGTTLNGTLFYGIIKERLYLTSSNLYILNLALSDIMIAIGILPVPFMAYAFESWPFGATSCRIVEIVRDVVTPVTVLTLTAMSFDRYKAVHSTQVRMAHHRRQSKFHLMDELKSRTGITIVIIWILAGISVMPLILFSHLVNLSKDRKGDHLVCLLDRYEYVEPKIIVVIRCLITYIIPLSIITYNYGAIVLRMYTLSRDLKGVAGRGSSAMERSRLKAKQRAKQIFFLVSIFLICSFPRHGFLWILYFFGEGVRSTQGFWNVWRTIAFYLFYIYPILNPVSLYITSEQFQQVFDKYLLRCKKAPEVILDDEETTEMTSKTPTTETQFLSTSHA